MNTQPNSNVGCHSWTKILSVSHQSRLQHSFLMVLDLILLASEINHHVLWSGYFRISMSSYKRLVRTFQLDMVTARSTNINVTSSNRPRRLPKQTQQAENHHRCTRHPHRIDQGKIHTTAVKLTDLNQHQVHQVHSPHWDTLHQI